MKSVFVYTRKYSSFDYGDSHPLSMERLRLTYLLCEAYGLFQLPGARVVETEPAGEDEVLAFHTPAYVNALKRASRGELSGYYTHGIGQGGDNPMFHGLWEWSLLHTGGSLQCARLLRSGRARVAFNIAGGLHHAAAYRASGFCYINDPVLAILDLVSHGLRVLYLDIDAHHGDGVQWAFYDDPRVLTVSFHQDGGTLFPGTGRITELGREAGEGYSVNVPMLPGTDDEVFWSAFLALVPDLVGAFDPDVVVSQLGVDGFLEDPLSSLELTTDSFSRVAAYIRDLGRPWLALGGGGYHIHNVARAWTLGWAVMNRVELPDELPPLQGARLPGAGPDRDRLRDPPHRSTRHGMAARYVEENIAFLRRNCLPMIGSSRSAARA